jgi:hypothetical protein
MRSGRDAASACALGFHRGGCPAPALATHSAQQRAGQGENTMKYAKMFGLAALAAALMAFVAAGTASATELDNATGMVTTGSTISAVNEGTVVLHPPIGDIECNKSLVSGKTTNTGGASETVKGNIESLTFENCNATVTVLKKGTLEIHSSGSNNGTLTSSGTEVTVNYLGFHCIFSTSSTDIGTLTGSKTTGKTATFDISATIPRTGGTSGFFCGSTAQWTGSYEITNPDTLNVT